MNLSRSAAQGARTDSTSAVARRVARLPISEKSTTMLVAVLLVLLVDSEALTLIPLAGHLGQEYGLSPTQVAFALSATGISGAAFVPVLARLGDIFGMRRLLLISLAFVVVGNIMCAVAEGPALLLAGRALVGVNAALPLLYAILRLQSRDKASVDRSSGLMTAAIGGGIAASFLFGGLVIEFGGSVRTVLEIMTGFSIVLAFLAWLFVQDSDVRSKVSVDYIGAVLMGTGLAGFVIALGQGNRWGWSSEKTLGLIAVSIILFAAWVWWELRTTEPLIDLRIVARREIWPAFGAVGIASVLGSASSLTTSNFVQTPTKVGYGFGGSVLDAGLYLIPVGIAIAIGGSIMAPVIRVMGQRRASALGGAIAAVTFFWFAANHDSPWQTILMMVLVGVSYALTFTAATSAYLSASRVGEGGMLTGAGRIASTGISSLGPAVVTALLTASFIPNTSVPEAKNYDAVWIFLGVLGLISVAFSLLIRNSTVDNSLAPKTEVLGSAAQD